MINVSVNNQLIEIPAQTNICQLIVLADFTDQMVAIAVNGEFIPKSQYSNTLLNNSDNVDIVKPIGGG